MNLLSNEQQYVNASFKCILVSWGVREPKAGSSTIMVALELQIVDAWNAETESWTSWESVSPAFGLYANVCIIKKDGQPNQTGIDQLCQSIGWDGTLSYFVQPVRSYIVVAQTVWNEYNGKKTIQVSWISHGSTIPRSGSGIANAVDDGGAKSLDAQFGSILRASTSKPQQAPIEGTPF